MTCIVGFVDKGIVYIGGDSAGVGGMDLRVRKDAKVFIKGKFIYGYTSSFRMGQLIRFRFKAPLQPKKINDYEYMCTLFVDAIRTCFKKGGYSEVDKNVERGGIFLVGYKGKLYQIESDFQVGLTIDNYDAVGCGGDFALGALAVMDGINLLPKERLTKALQVAENLSAGVRGPFNIISSKGAK